MSKLDVDDVAYMGKPIALLNKEELLQALLALANIINSCPVKGKCEKLLDTTDTKHDRR